MNGKQSFNQHKEGTMFKKFGRFIFISVLVMSAVALWGNEAFALRSLGGCQFSTCKEWNYNISPPVCVQSSYHAKFLLIGGDNPHIATYLVGTYFVIDGWLEGYNPQGKSVLVGLAGLAETTVTSPGVNFLLDENGKYYLGQVLWNEVEEFTPTTECRDPDDPGDYCCVGTDQYDADQCADRYDYVQQLCKTYSVYPPDPANTTCDSVTAFLNYWNIHNIEDLLNNRWIPSKVLITAVGVNGEFSDCTDPNIPSTCTSYGSKSWICATDEDPRTGFPGPDGEVIYVCVEKYHPIAFDDSYTARKNKTLSVSAPGVLENDKDYETTPDTLSVKNPSTFTTDHGEVTLRADGSFDYTPEPNYRGPDSFTYVAFDADGDSNEATVTITVK